MKKAALLTILLVLVIFICGCEPDSGTSRIRPKQVKKAVDRQAVIDAAMDKEVDIVETMSGQRNAYRQSLVALIKHYRQTGNYMKREWARKELAELDKIPQYNYIIEAATAPADLKATTEIPAADDLYYQAVVIEEDARRLLLPSNKDKRRLALDKYDQMIRQYPTSDKIDDAAYRAANIYEGFKDYSIALIYYQRAYQWDAETVYPARYRAAKILDYQLSRRSEALDLYRESLQYDALSATQREAIQLRISELTLGTK